MEAAAVWCGVVVIAWLVWRYFLRDFVVRPGILGAEMFRQGIRGPPRKILLGNLSEMMKMRDESESRDLPTGCHDIEDHVMPHLVRWSKLYGIPFLMWWAYEPRIIINDMDMIKETLYNRGGNFWRSPMQQTLLGGIIGRGLVTVNGEEWALSRRMVAPAFYAEKIKEMSSTMVSCIQDMLKKWDEVFATSQQDSVELEVHQELVRLTADVISRTAFGGSFRAGNKAFQLLQELSPLVVKANTSLWNPWLNKKISRVKGELNACLEAVIESRRALKKSGNLSNYGDDLLGIMLEEVDKNLANGTGKFTNENLVDECKTFYAAGHETTAQLLTWTMMLLALNPSWQDRARDEVLQTCQGLENPNAETANKMKVVGMILNEALRLYPPALMVLRHAYKDMKLGNLTIPEGMGIHVPVLTILHDPELWGANVDEFHPERFSEGVANACRNDFGFLPFSQGPRVCVGRTFALVEAKLAIAMVLQRFRWELSPSYRHNPILRLTLRPKYGMPLIVHKLIHG